MTNELNPGDAIAGRPRGSAKLAEAGVLRDFVETLPLDVLIVDREGGGDSPETACEVSEPGLSRELFAGSESGEGGEGQGSAEGVGAADGIAP